MAQRRSSDSRLLRRDSAILEAASLVHRKLGTSKRFSESDKRDIAQILVSELTALQDESRRETETLKNRLDSAKIENREKNRIQGIVFAYAFEFVKSHGRRLESHAHDMTTTTELLQRLASSPEKDQIQECLERLLARTSKVFQGMDSISYEQEKCLRLLGATETGVLGPSLFEVLCARTDVLQLGKDSPESVEDKDKLIDDLTRRVRALNEAVSPSRESVACMRRRLKDAEEEIEQLKGQTTSVPIA